MGYIVHDGDVLEFTVEDRLLAHLQIVIVNAFRQNQSFLFSWEEPIGTGATELPGGSGSHVDWATDRPEPPTSRVARLPRR